jgi:hypothetical protein
LAAAQLATVGSAVAQSVATHASFASPKQIDTGTLSVGYAEAGPADGPVRPRSRKADRNSATVKRADLLRSRPVPLASFTAVMGIIGAGIDSRSARAWEYAGIVGESVIAVGIVVFIILTVRWLLRIRSDRKELVAESSRALTANYFAAIGISLALTAAAIVPYCALGAGVLWFISATGGAALVLSLLGNWIQIGIATSELTPASFLPVVGNAVSVYVAADAGIEQYVWFSFSLAVVCWLALLPLALYRLIAVGSRLPRRLAPQLAIFIASPAVLANAFDRPLEASRLGGAVQRRDVGMDVSCSSPGRLVRANSAGNPELPLDDARTRTSLVCDWGHSGLHGGSGAGVVAWA